MKTVAKHDNQWELQKHETHQVVERNCARGSPLCMSGSVSFKNIINLRDGDWQWWLRSTLLKFRASALETNGLVGFVLAAMTSLILLPTSGCKIYPLNLSISLSGGKESNSDSFSNGE